jgi:hypothetical protein
VTAEGKGKTEWLVELVINTSWDHVTSYRSKDCSCHEYFFLIGYEYEYIYMNMNIYVYMNIYVCII